MIIFNFENMNLLRFVSLFSNQYVMVRVYFNILFKFLLNTSFGLFLFSATSFRNNFGHVFSSKILSNFSFVLSQPSCQSFFSIPFILQREKNNKKIFACCRWLS